MTSAINLLLQKLRTLSKFRPHTHFTELHLKKGRLWYNAVYMSHPPSPAVGEGELGSSLHPAAAQDKEKLNL